MERQEDRKRCWVPGCRGVAHRTCFCRDHIRQISDDEAWQLRIAAASPFWEKDIRAWEWHVATCPREGTGHLAWSVEYFMLARAVSEAVGRREHRKLARKRLAEMRRRK